MNRLICKVLCYCILIPMLGCGPKKIDSNTLYNEISMNRGKVFSTYREAVEKIPPIDLPMGAETKEKITKTDPKWASNGLISNFKIFKIKMEKDRRYLISVKSYCDCGGFTKQLLATTSTLVDKNGNILSSFDDPIPYHASFSEPLRLFSGIEIQLNKTMETYLFVGADNSLAGKESLKFSDDKGKKINIGADITGHPVGDIVLFVQKALDK